MPSFFATPSSTLVEHESILIGYQTKKVKFNPNDLQHIKLVSDCALSVRDRLNNLQEIDKKITAGLSFGIAALSLSYFLPFSFLAAGGFIYSAYQMGRRRHAYVEYTSALENLSKCCIWTLGEIPQEIIKQTEIIENLAIKEMIITLAPLTSAQQLRDFIDDKVEDEIVIESDKIKSDTTLFDQHLDKEKMDLYFKIYGYKQGGFLSILEGVAYAIKNGFIALKTAVVSMVHSDSEEPVSTAPTPK